MRNVAFSMLLGALALLQVAVVAAEFSRSDAQVAAARTSKASPQYVVASAQTGGKTAAL